MSLLKAHVGGIMKFWNEFKAFAMRGNVVDLAVAFIVGGAFNKIVTSLVTDVIMPPIGLALGEVSFGQLYINLSSKTYATLEEATKAGAPIIKYGAFVQTVVDFVIVAFVVFCMVKLLTRLHLQQTKDSAAPPEEVLLLREIRDSLKKS